MQTTDTHHAQVELIRSESQRLREYVNALPPEALERPSPCEMWNVGEVIAHLVWFAETYGGMIERGLRGDQSPTEGFPAVPGTLSSQGLAEMYGQAAIDRRRSLGQDLIPAVTERYDWLNNMLAGIGPEDWDKPCYHTNRIRSVESFIPTIVTEIAVHEWDIRSTLEPSPHLSSNSIPILMGRFPQGRRWSTFPAGSAASGSLRYRIDLTGPGAQKFDVVVEANNPRMEDNGEGPADLVFEGDTGSFVLLFYGRVTIDSVIASGLFNAEGDMNLIPAFGRWLGG